MKKLLSIILVLTMIFALASCGSKDEKTEDALSGKVQVSKDEPQKEGEDKPEEKAEEAETSETEKPAEKEDKPSAPQNPQDKKPAQTTETKPESKPEAKPETKPEEKPAEQSKPAEPKTVAYTLLDAFKANAGSDCLTIANTLVANPVIKFSGGAMEIAEGYLAGFDNTEIKGFKSGAMFAPMIGTIPFVGYVFELESADKTAAFISTLKANANLRWNICTSAEEMVASAVGNKVFFVMSPLAFEE